MIGNIICGICLISFVLMLVAINYIGRRYDDDFNMRKTRDPFYWTSTVTFPREEDKNG